MRTGWVAGAGAEFAITPHVLARAEWLHYDLGTASFLAAGSNVDVTHKGDLVRGGVAYKW